MRATSLSHRVPRKMKGLFCQVPECLSPRLEVTSIYRPVAGVKIRYCKCPRCGCHYKTREVIITVHSPRKLATGS